MPIITFLHPRPLDVDTYTPLAISTSAIAPALQSNSSGNFLISNPDVPRNLTVTFAGGFFTTNWDGGDVTVYGEDIFGRPINEVFLADPGSTVIGSKIFSRVTSAVKSTIGVTTAVATIGTGSILNLINRIDDDTLLVLYTDNLAFTLQLPLVTDIRSGRRICIQKQNTSSNNITISALAPSLIDGVANRTLTTRFTDITIINDGTDWVQTADMGLAGPQGDIGPQGALGPQGPQGSGTSGEAVTGYSNSFLLMGG